MSTSRSATDGSVLDVKELLKIELKTDNIQSFNTRWHEIQWRFRVSWTTKSPCPRREICGTKHDPEKKRKSTFCSTIELSTTVFLGKCDHVKKKYSGKQDQPTCFASYNGDCPKGDYLHPPECSFRRQKGNCKLGQSTFCSTPSLCRVRNSRSWDLCSSNCFSAPSTHACPLPFTGLFQLFPESPVARLCSLVLQLCCLLSQVCPCPESPTVPGVEIAPHSSAQSLVAPPLCLSLFLLLSLSRSLWVGSAIVRAVGESTTIDPPPLESKIPIVFWPVTHDAEINGLCAVVA